jgi:hypothetical protein
MAIDVEVVPATLDAWDLRDRLGRPVGKITRSNGAFRIEQVPSSQRLSGMTFGPFKTLDAAMSEIEKHTKGACQLAHGT